MMPTMVMKGSDDGLTTRNPLMGYDLDVRSSSRLFRHLNSIWTDDMRLPN